LKGENMFWFLSIVIRTIIGITGVYVLSTSPDINSIQVTNGLLFLLIAGISKYG
jgi:hypothetical protein